MSADRGAAPGYRPDEAPPTHRMLPDFLTRGDAALDLPRLRGNTRFIGRGFPEIADEPPSETHDPASAHASAVHAWLRHVAAGRMG